MAPLRVVAPLVAAFLLFLGIIASSIRRPEAPAEVAVAGRSRIGRLRRLLSSAVGGYVVFLLIVLVFHVIIAGQREAMSSAITGGALLAFVVSIPAFVLLSRIESGLRRRGAGRS
jgi:hypothetical protein